MLKFISVRLSEVLSNKRIIYGFFIYITLKIYLIADSLPALTDSDSGSYTSGNGFANWGWVSFSGGSHGRGWPTVLIYSLVYDNSGRVILQQFFGLISWTLFVIAVNSLISIRRINYFWLITIGLISLSPYSQYYNNWIGRESISLSLCLISISFLIFFISYRSSLLLILMVLMITLMIITKPSLMPFGLSILIVTIFIESKKVTLSKKSFVSWFACFILISYGFVNVGNQNEGWGKADPTGRTANEINYSYLISDFNSQANNVKSYFSSIGAPSCATGLAPTTQNNLGAPMEYAGFLHNNCVGFSDFIRKSFLKGYLKYVVLNPIYSIKLVLEHFVLANKLAGGQSFSEGRSQTPIMYFIFSTTLLNIFVFLCLLGVIVGLLMGSQEMKRNRDYRFVIAFAAMGIGSLGSIVCSLLLMPTHASDLARQNWVASLLLRLMLVVLMTLVIQAQGIRKNIV